MLRSIFTILTIQFMFLCVLTTNAQEKTDKSESGIFDVSFGADLMSRYVWRGGALSTAPVIQPGMELSAKGFAFGAWGSYSFLGPFDGAEADLYLSYTALNGMLTVTVTDYFFPSDAMGADDYFRYGEDETGHIFEGTIAFNGTEDLPLTFLVAANLYGADNKKVVDDPNSADFNQEDGNQFSTYLELGYSFSLKQTDLTAFIGFTPNDPKEADPTTGYIGESGFYGHSMGIMNMGVTGTHEVKITDSYSLPLQASFIANPMSENIFIVFGISF